MDNPAISSVRQDDFNETIGGLAAGISSGEKLPLLLYRVYVADGHEELVRGGVLNGLTLRSIRNLAGIGNDVSVFDYLENPSARICRHGARRFRLGAIRDSQLDCRAFDSSGRRRSSRFSRRAAPLASRHRTASQLADGFVSGSTVRIVTSGRLLNRNGQHRHADPSIHVHLRSRALSLVPSLDVRPASFRQPEWRKKRRPHLPAVCMARQAKVHVPRNSIEVRRRVK